MALFAKASSELQRHNPEAAVQFAKEAFEIQPGDAYIAASLGLMHTFNGQPKEAYKYLERAIERERVPIYRARAEYFMLQAAYMAGDYQRAEQAYHAHLEAGGTCFSDCLFFAAATKAALAVTGKSPDETRAFNDQAASILKELRGKYPTYEIARLPERIKLYRENGDRLKIQRTARTLGAFAPSSTSQP
jgi:tetratricopeptide (TPR) repeat protein